MAEMKKTEEVGTEGMEGKEENEGNEGMEGIERKEGIEGNEGMEGKEGVEAMEGKERLRVSRVVGITPKGWCRVRRCISVTTWYYTGRRWSVRTAVYASPSP